TKLALQRMGLFPAARATYRFLNTGIRRQRRREIDFYRTLLSPGSLCFDIGANLGQKAEVFLSCGARVLIVEPNLLCQPTLNFHFGRNPNAELVMSAVGRAESSTTLYVHGTDATASVRPEWDLKTFGVNRPTTRLMVPTTSLDSLIDQYGRPDYVK